MPNCRVFMLLECIVYSCKFSINSLLASIHVFINLYSNLFVYSSFRLFVSIIKYMCMSLIPLAAIASLTIHFLIMYDQIQVIDSPTSSVRVIEKAADKVSNRVSEIGITSGKKFIN